MFVRKYQTAEELLNDMLIDINLGRQALALPPLAEIPRGQRRDARNCPIARALTGRGTSVQVDQRTVCTNVATAQRLAAVWKTRLTILTVDGSRGGIATVVLPDGLSTGRSWFDKGKLPQLHANQPVAPQPAMARKLATVG